MQTTRLMRENRATRRAEARRPLVAQTAVLGFDDLTTRWAEQTRTVNGCRGGLAFPLAHRVFPGQVLQLQTEVPASLRRFGADAPTYNVFAIVRHVRRGAPPLVGVMFHGKTAPAGFTASPAGSFMLPAQTTDVRRTARHQAVLTVKVGLGQGPCSELAITEDLSAGGARLLTALPLSIGDDINVDIDNGAVFSAARVCGAAPADHGTMRVSVFFLDPLSRTQALTLLRRLGL